MSNPLESLTLAAGSDALPLELLQPLDGANPASTPVRLSGPEQRLTVTPDPGVGDDSLLPPRSLLHIDRSGRKDPIRSTPTSNSVSGRSRRLPHFRPAKT